MKKNIDKTNISEIIEDYMKKYGKKVIEDRAIPALIDGLKPVQRRILYSMFENKQISDVKTVKSARVVGNTMGVYHPHGDKSIYDTIVNMVIPWNNIIPLIKGEGNFSNVDGDSPGAMRYTEISIPNKIAKYLFSDMHLTEYKPNYDNKTKEPFYLLPKIPFILFNGTTGIAFTIKTVIPQYVPEEILNLLIFLINKKFWKYEKEKFKEKYKNQLLEIFQGPDSSVGCNIEITEEEKKNFLFEKEAKAKYFAKYEINHKSNEIKITSLVPEITSKKIYEELLNLYINYLEIKSNKKRNNKLLEKKYLIFKDKPYNLSKNDKVNIVLKYKKTDDLKKKAAKIFQTSKTLNKNITFRPIFLDIKLSGENEEILPVNISLFNYLIWFLNFRKKILIKKLNYQKSIYLEEIEHNNLLLFTLKNLNKIQKIITEYVDSNQNNVTLLYNKLINKLNLTEKNIKTILSFNLLKIANIDKENITAKINELEKLIKDINNKLNNEELLYKEIKKDFVDFKKDFKKEIKRKSTILLNNDKSNTNKILKNYETEFYILIKEKTIGNIKKYYIQKVPKELIKKIKNNNNTIIKDMFNENDYILFFSDKGKLYNIKVSEVNIIENNIENYLKLEENENILNIFLNKNNIENFLLFVKNNGYVKITETQNIKKFLTKTINKTGKKMFTKENNIIAIYNIKQRFDNIISLYTKKGYCLNFKITDIPLQSLTTNGVIGIKLNEEDEIKFSKLTFFNINCIINKKKIQELLKNKKIKFIINNNNFLIQKRGGKGKKI